MFENGDGSWLVVQSVRGHQKHVRSARRGDHGECFVLAHSERLLDHDMLAGACRPNGEISMHVVRQSNIDRIDRGTRQQGVVAIIADNRANAVEVRKARRLCAVAGHDGRNPRISGLNHAGQERLLRDPAGADDGIVDHQFSPGFRRSNASKEDETSRARPMVQSYSDGRDGYFSVDAWLSARSAAICSAMAEAT